MIKSGNLNLSVTKEYAFVTSLWKEKLISEGHRKRVSWVRAKRYNNIPRASTLIGKSYSNRILKGVDVLANAVSVTLGPKGKVSGLVI